MSWGLTDLITPTVSIFHGLLFSWKIKPLGLEHRSRGLSGHYYSISITKAPLWHASAGLKRGFFKKGLIDEIYLETIDTP